MSSRNIKEALISNIGLGISIVLGLLCLFIFSYVLVIGIGIGLLIFACNTLRQRFVRSRPSKQAPDQDTPGNRVIDHDDPNL